MMFFYKCVEWRVHPIQHSDNLHGWDGRANIGEAHNITEQDRTHIKHLQIHVGIELYMYN